MARTPQTSPTVSVVIPARDAAAYIEVALGACLRQTRHDLEVLVVDDGSVDSTATLVRRVDDPRVRLLSFARSRGVGAARNAALDVARGTWIATLDADDTMSDDRLEVLVAAAEAHGVDMVHDDLFLLHEGESEPYATLASSTDAGIDAPVPVDLDRLIDCELGGPSRYRLGLTRPLMRRAFLDRHGLRYDPTLKVGEDHRLYLECLLAGASWLQLPDAHYVYLQRAGSAVSAPVSSTLEAKHRVCIELLARTTLTPAQRASLLRYRRNLASLLAYQRVVDRAKARHLGAALGAALHHPEFLRRVGTEVPALVRRRWAFHVRGERHALDMLPPPGTLRASA